LSYYEAVVVAQQDKADAACAKAEEGRDASSELGSDEASNGGMW
jgi:hypothetical protein